MAAFCVCIGILQGVGHLVADICCCPPSAGLKLTALVPSAGKDLEPYGRKPLPLARFVSFGHQMLRSVAYL